QTSCYRHTGIEIPIRHPAFRLPKNFQIDPFASGGHFKFKITFGLVCVGCEKDLTYVTIPKTEGFLPGLRVGVYYWWFALLANKPRVQCVVRPEQVCFSVPRGRRRFS